MIMRLRYRASLSAAATAILMSGCGGGGGSDATGGTNTAAYPFLSAYKAKVANGETVHYSVSGSCAGSMTSIDTSPSASTFEGAAVLKVQDTTTASFTNCTPASVTSNSVDYYDSNYNPLGSTGDQYGVFLVVPAPLPTYVSVGDSATYGTETWYADGTKTVVTGTSKLSYVIEQDGTSNSTVIVNLKDDEYDSSGKLVGSQQNRYRLDGNGTLTPVAVDVQNGSTHLVLTAQ